MSRQEARKSDGAVFGGTRQAERSADKVEWKEEMDTADSEVSAVRINV